MTRIRLAIQPPAALFGSSDDAGSADSPVVAPARTDSLAVHKAILKRLNFVLDVEAASSFPDDVDVVYSWGQNDYRYAQYIHRSGSTLAQITDAGDFLLLANRLYSWRSSSNVAAAPAVAAAVGGGAAPASPALRAVAAAAAAAAADGPHRDDRASPPAPSTAEVKDGVEAFCGDEAALLAFYDEFRRSPATAMAGRHQSADGMLDGMASPGPRAWGGGGAVGTPLAASHVLEAHIPALRLPPKGPPESAGAAGPS
jgi:hypothetical protein